MAAATSLAHELRMLVCGDCAAALIAAGASSDSDVKTIALGTCCETHETSRPATNALIVPSRALDALRAKRAEAETATTEEPPPPPWAPPASSAPTSIGPVTEIAARIFCSWSQGKPEASDDAALEAAVIFARKLVAQTKGR